MALASSAAAAPSLHGAGSVASGSTRTTRSPTDSYNLSSRAHVAVVPVSSRALAEPRKSLSCSLPRHASIQTRNAMALLSHVAAAAAVETTAPPEAIATQKIRIKLKAYQVPQAEEASQMILDVAKTTGASSMGPVRLPTHIRRYCVLRSPHVDKDSREHFEIRTHKRLIDIKSPTAQTIDALMQVELPYGVVVDVKLL